MLCLKHTRMDNEQLLDRVQNLLLGMEERIDGKFKAVDRRFDEVYRRFDEVDSKIELVDRKVESVRAEVKLHNELLAPFITWSHRIEDEVIRLSAALQDLQTRLAKLENPTTRQ
jgi:chromosome segregation ATPase